MADAHAKPHHDYHLVEPSPWPALGSVSAFVAAVGGITWMHHLFPAAPYIFGVGVIGILYTMLGWWTDVAREATHEGFHTQVVQISHRYGMILFIASEVMFFVDPELTKDWEQDGLDTITLSYTMYPARRPEAPRVGGGAALAPGRS